MLHNFILFYFLYMPKQKSTKRTPVATRSQQPVGNEVLPPDAPPPVSLNNGQKERSPANPPISSAAPIQEVEGSNIRPVVNVVDDSNDLGFVISDSIKNKVANLQYVEIEYFSKPSSLEQEPEETCLTLKDGCFNLKKSPKPKQLYNINDWTDAFINFGKLLLESHPTRSLQILTYMSTIRGAARDHSFSAAMAYDKQFRMKLGKFPEKSFSLIDGQLWLLCMTRSRPTVPVQTDQRYQTNACFNYNYKDLCTRRPCPYVHICLKCKQKHPIKRCPNNHHNRDKNQQNVNSNFISNNSSMARN